MSRLCSTLLKEQEWCAVSFTKIIQFLIETGYKEPSRNQDPKYFTNFFASFYETLGRKIDSLKRIEDYVPHLINLPVVTDSRGAKVKSAPMEWSMSYFADIIAHIIMIIENSFLDNDLLFNKIKDLFLELILGFERVQLDSLRTISDEYYTDLIYAMNKTLTYVGKMLTRLKVSEPPQKPVDKIARAIFEKTKKGKELIKILLHILKHSSPEKPKQIHDCYVNISMYASICPELLLEHFDEFFGNGIFRAPTLSWTPHDFMNVYLSYNSALRTILYGKGEGMVQQISKLFFAQVYTLVDNLLYIIFDSRTFPNFYTRAVEDLKQLVEYVKKDIESQGPLHRELAVGATATDKYPRYSAFLARVLQKLVVQLKVTRDHVEELMAYLAQANVRESAERGTKIIDELVFKEMPRYEENPSPQAMQEKVLQFIGKTEQLLADDSIFYYHNHYRTVVSPLMEDKEGFMMNSYPVNPNMKLSINNFIEEYLFKRVALLNDVSMILFLELANLSFDSRTATRRAPDDGQGGTQRVSYYYQTYPETELSTLRKMYRYTLEIFHAFAQDPQHMKESPDSFRFSTAPFERVDKDEIIRMDQRQLYQLFEECLPLFFLTLKKLYRSVDIYPQLYYIFFDCFVGTDFQQQASTPERPPAGQPAQPERPMQNNGLYMLNLLSELFIRYIMIMVSKLPEKLDSFHFLYDKDINIHYLFIKILKFIYRMIKFKMDSNKPYANEMIVHLKKHTFKLVMVILKLSSKLC